GTHRRGGDASACRMRPQENASATLSWAACAFGGLGLRPSGVQAIPAVPPANQQGQRTTPPASSGGIEHTAGAGRCPGAAASAAATTPCAATAYPSYPCHHRSSCHSADRPPRAPRAQEWGVPPQLCVQ
ncbi:hypothetical protein Agub_g8161, partial [Astrephomene gubernaculifera]